MPIEAVNVHGLDNAFLADKPVFADIVDDFLKFIEGAELIIHNASFDVGFLNMELGRLGKGRIEDYCLKVTDSLKMASDMFPGLRNNLDVLCTRYEIDRSARTLHGALLDARLLAEVYLAMTRKQGELLGDTYEAGEKGFQIPDKSLFVRAEVPADELAEHEAFLERIAKKCKKGVAGRRHCTPKNRRMRPEHLPRPRPTPKYSRKTRQKPIECADYTQAPFLFDTASFFPNLRDD